MLPTPLFPEGGDERAESGSGGGRPRCRMGWTLERRHAGRRMGDPLTRGTEGVARTGRVNAGLSGTGDRRARRAACRRASARLGSLHLITSRFQLFSLVNVPAPKLVWCLLEKKNLFGGAQPTNFLFF